MNRIFHLSALSLTFALAACGGGGGDASQSVASAPTDPAPSTAPANSTSPGASTAPTVPTAPAASAPATATPSTPTASTAPATEPPTASNTALAANTTCGINNFQQELLKLVNQARATSRYCGTTYYQAAEPLGWNSKLFAAAAGHAADMATNNYFSHVSLDGRTFSQRITAAGYNWNTAGENIAAGQSTLQEVMTGWLDSPGHCENIMNGMYSEIGVSCVPSSTSDYKQYWAMELGDPR